VSCSIPTSFRPHNSTLSAHTVHVSAHTLHLPVALTLKLPFALTLALLSALTLTSFRPADFFSSRRGKSVNRTESSRCVTLNTLSLTLSQLRSLSFSHTPFLSLSHVYNCLLLHNHTHTSPITTPTHTLTPTLTCN